MRSLGRIRSSASRVTQELEGRYQILSRLTQRPNRLKVTPDTLRVQQQAFERLALPDVDLIERDSGFAVDRWWLSELALQTQVTFKESGPNYAHGRLIYSLLRQRLKDWPRGQPATVLDIGTARGFSALTASRAALDSGVSLSIISLDTVSHTQVRYWGTVADLDGRPRSREALIALYPESQGVTFVGQSSRIFLSSAVLARCPFAFIDGAHTYGAVRFELEQIAQRQRAGDMLLLDDASSEYPGVVKAADRMGQYRHTTIAAGGRRVLRLMTRLA